MSVKIIEQELHNDDGVKVGKVAILFCLDVEKLNNAVANYVGDERHNQFIDITCCNPWYRLIISGIDKIDYHSLGTDMELIHKVRD
jgi:hypothetical protein